MLCTHTLLLNCRVSAEMALPNLDEDYVDLGRSETLSGEEHPRNGHLAESQTIPVEAVAGRAVESTLLLYTICAP